MKSSTITAIAFSILVGLPTSSVAGSEDVVVEDAWSRASVGTNRPGAAYMTLRNTGSAPVDLDFARGRPARYSNLVVNVDDDGIVQVYAADGELDPEMEAVLASLREAGD